MTKPIDWSRLAEDYTRLGTERAVAQAYGCSERAVQIHAKRQGIRIHYDKAGAKNPKWRGGRRKDKNGYVQVYAPDHPHRNVRNEVPEHRLVMERVLGRHLTPQEVVHHINGVTDDNRPENLTVLEDNGRHVFHMHRRYRGRAGQLHATEEARDLADSKIAEQATGPSVRETQVLGLWNQGLDRAAIAARLGIDRKNVHYYLTRLLTKGFIQSRLTP